MKERTWYEKIDEKGKEAVCLAIRMKKKNYLQPCERFELSSPGLRDQCSDH